MKVAVEVPIIVRYSETDQMKVAYHVHYLVWFNIARDELMKKIGIEIKQGESLGYLFPVSEIYCKYLSPARYADELIIKATAQFSSVAKLEVNYEVIHKKTRNILATGKTVNVLTTKDGRLLLRLPEELKKLLNQNII